MKKFIFFITITSITLFFSDRLLTLACDLLYKEIRTGQTGGKLNLYLSKPTPQMAIMGNSRAFYQIIPDSFRFTTFNLAHAGQTQIFQNGLLQILKHDSKIPSIVLLHVEPDELLGSIPHHDIQNLKYYYGKEPYITEKLNQLSPFERVKFSFGLYRYNGRAITLFKNYVQTKISFRDNNGYEPIYPTLRDSINTLYSSEKVKDDTTTHFNYEHAEYLMEFIAICRKENINLICFTSPIFKITNQNKEASIKLDSLLAAKQIPYINFLIKPVQQLQAHPKYWKDANHLNHNGAQIESKILAREVQRILTSPAAN